nr:EAL domain-containing protein [Vibrio sp. S17_S38]
MSFIDLIGSDAVSAPLVDNIIDLARRLNLSLTAEGVEDQVQVDYLKENGVDYLQGYFYGKPIPLDEFIRTYLK